MAYKTKPMDAININTIESQIDNCIVSFFDKRNIDINDMPQCKAITHNVLTLCFMNVYETLFKPDKTLYNNQRSLIDYDNIELLSIICNSFIKWTLYFDKSFGLMQFSIFTGIHRKTLAEWRDHDELNPARSDLIKTLCETHKMEQINLLNGSPVGSLAVANNDSETGLEWSKQQAQQIAQNAVYILPSERVERLKLDKQQDQNNV